jgi:hypothetical protein
LKVLTPNITAGQNVIIKVGKAESTNNCGYFGFDWASSGSVSNYLTLGFYATDHRLKIYPDKATFANKIETPAITLNGTDLQTTLDSKAASSHTHTASQITDFIDKVYPVGSIYTSVSSANPNTLFGGTWTSFGSGRCLFGVDTGSTEFNTAQKTGGEKTHTLTTSEIPSHTHTIDRPLEKNGDAHSGIGISHVVWRGAAASTTLNATSGSTGSGQAHNNLPPYICVYMWLRTA